MNKIGALILAGILVLYIAVTGARAIELLRSGEAVGVAMGAALVVLPLIGIWFVVTELRMGFALESLMRRLADEGGLPDALPTAPSGRPDRDAADAAFPAAKAEVDAHPDQWQSWLRLSLAYDAARDRARARRAAREAIRLAKQDAGAKHD